MARFVSKYRTLWALRSICLRILQRGLFVILNITCFFFGVLFHQAGSAWLVLKPGHRALLYIRPPTLTGQIWRSVPLLSVAVNGHPAMPRPTCLCAGLTATALCMPQSCFCSLSPAVGQVHRRRAPTPGDAALGILPAGSRWRLHMSVSDITAIMDGLTLRKRRNPFVVLLKPVSVLPADTNQPSLVGMHKPPSLRLFASLKVSTLQGGSQTSPYYCQAPRW